MTVKELNKITAALIASGKGNSEVAINYATFIEHDEATILPVEGHEHKRVGSMDDSGPLPGATFPFFILRGTP